MRISDWSSDVCSSDLGDRLQTLERVRKAGINTCCGGIIGMGETRDDRAGFLMALANLPEHPGSVPINGLVPVSGTPLGDRLLSGDSVQIDAIEFVQIGRAHV